MLADRIGQNANLARGTVKAGIFNLTYFSRLADPSAPVAVYVEGDGFAWRNRSTPSVDPTPTRPLGLELAAVDPSANVLYLARPCQFTRNDPACRPAYWTDLRFSEEVIASIDQAIDAAVPWPRRSINLVGYSGGGAVAALVAARRNDIASLRTIAGNLDHAALNAHHGVSQMTGSLNPVDFAPALARLPQRHYAGAKDKIVPPFVAERFLRAQGDLSCADVVAVPDADHSEGWITFWSLAVLAPPRCRH